MPYLYKLNNLLANCLIAKPVTQPTVEQYRKYPPTNRYQKNYLALLLTGLFCLSVSNNINSAPLQQTAPLSDRSVEKETTLNTATQSQTKNEDIQLAWSYTLGIEEKRLKKKVKQDKIYQQEKVADVVPAEPNTAFIDIWPRLRDGFQLSTYAEVSRSSEQESETRDINLQQELNWFTNNPEYMHRVLERAEPFLFYIMEEAEKLNLPTELALLPIIESAFRPFAYSHGRAAGLWQFIPSTGRAYGLKQNWWYDGRRDIHASTQAALKYLAYLNRVFDGDWLLALAAYNSGQGTVKKAMRKNKKLNRPTDFWSLTLPKETRAYVPKLFALKEVISYPENYFIDVRFIANEPGFTPVKINQQIDLALAAELADIDLEKIYQYNPGFNRWATDPDGPHQLLLPTNSAAIFEANYSALPDNKHIQWKRHKITSGESLGRLAQKYHTSISHLKKVNKINNNEITAGNFLLIPTSSRDKDSYALSASERLKSTQNKKRKNKKQTYHTVKNGESFWKIAKKYHIAMRDLATWNGLSIKDSLKKGQKLVIWSKKHFNQSKKKISNTMTSIHYIVRNGDSLSRIASKYRVNVRDIHRWNTIKGKYIKPGQRLKLFIDVTEQSYQS